jgi:hypothetical protein
MDHLVREQAMDYFFRPTTALLQRYGRYAAPDEVVTFEKRFNDLHAELALAFDNGEIYEVHSSGESSESYARTYNSASIYKGKWR